MSNNFTPRQGVLYAVDNARHRAFVVGTKHSVGGIPVKYFLLDTGCNSSLLNIEDGQLQSIFKAFPPQEYTYQISQGGGVATVQDPVMTITTLLRPIEWQLSIDLNQFNFTTVSLRFHICYDDAVEILKYAPDFMHTGALSTYVKTMDVVKSAVDKFETNRRRKHSLLGRTVLELALPPNSLVSHRGATMVGQLSDMQIKDNEFRNARNFYLAYMEQAVFDMSHDDFNALENVYDPEPPVVDYDYVDERTNEEF